MEENNNEKNIVPQNLKEILNKVSKMKQLTPAQISDLEKKVKESIDFKKIIENIEIPKDNYVIFTDGEEQLIYENGEFFLVSSIDSTKEKKKKKRLEAKDMYIEYFIRNTLNKIQNKQDISLEKVKEIPSMEKSEVPIQKGKNEEVKNDKVEKKDGTRAEEIEKSLKSMVKPVNEDYERTKIIDKIKSGKEKSDKVR